ncbi:PilZ domain-containing protein [Acanthopleuribacter pedis]|uniref:PilZ domain-containing protein n=1 Tax=Acanthopleuribacter pedis TaxID=442870 RepID=A0A8J7QAS9_9BACT|nr:PilZ domain-containing protein [Acanthopleuribacter pedis]MBO1320224.1 PilZ domain-containing protein [Acanthopleuribacter pedis]
MGLKDFLGLTPKDEEPHFTDREQILAYLEDQIGPGTPESVLEPVQAKMDPFMVRIEGVFENKGTFSVMLNHRPPKPIPKGTPFILYFVVSNHRVRTCQIQYQRPFRDNMHILTLPKKIYHAERRGQGRGGPPMRDKSQVLILESLEQGIGLHGRPVNFSKRGLGIKIDKAMRIKGQKFIPVTKDLYPIGTQLMMVRLKNLAGIRQIECSCEVRHISYLQGRYLLGLRIADMAPEEISAYERFLESRNIVNHDDFPLIARLKKGGAEKTKPAAPASQPALVPKASSGGEPAAAGAPAAEVEPAKPPPAARGEKPVALIVAPTGPVRAKLVASLLKAGFKLTQIDHIQQLANLAAGRHFDAVFVYGGEDHAFSLATLDIFAKMPYFKALPLVMVTTHLDMRTKIAAKSHGIKHVLDVTAETAPADARSVLS